MSSCFHLTFQIQRLERPWGDRNRRKGLLRAQVAVITNTYLPVRTAS